MHALVVTEGVVLGKRGVGEANIFLAILTRERGLLKASARSARREASKLRYALEPLTLATYTFVRGKHEWKLIGAQDAERLLPADTPLVARRATARAARLLLRLVHGEEKNDALYTTFSEGLRALAAAAPEALPHIETVLVLRVLAHLGYLPQTPELAPFMEGDFFSHELAAEVERSRAILAKAINDSLSATGL
ncbi:MAG TPA: recombination protein O N-terminal domain-containing protein [Candidatus Paceibacterota bacterium]|nr:recombination protein O N-terminal domain-containing protein [Candidatus Paceibacterota bacterium]